MFSRCYFVLLVTLLAASDTLGDEEEVEEVEDFIKRWRNEVGGPIQYIYGTQVGMDNTYHDFTVNSQDMVECIENQRLIHGKDDYVAKGVTKFETVFKLFGLCFCKFLTNSISKCEATIDYSHEDLQSRHYKLFKVEQILGDIKYFDQSNLPEQAERVFVKSVINRGNKDVTSTVAVDFDKTETFLSSYTWEIGGSLGGTAEFSFFGISSKIEIELSYTYTSTKDQQNDKTSHFSVKSTFTIPPHSSREIICTLSRKYIDLEWEIPIIVTGAVAINTEKTKKGGNWLFVDVKYVAQYFKELSLTRDYPPRLQGFVRGRTRGSQHYDAKAYDQPSDETKTPVQNNLCNPVPSKVKK